MKTVLIVSASISNNHRYWSRINLSWIMCKMIHYFQRVLLLSVLISMGSAFSTKTVRLHRSLATIQNLSENNSNEPEIKFSRPKTETMINFEADQEVVKEESQAAATNTVNERLMAELKAAENKEKFGARSSAGKKLGLVDGYGRPRKTDEEIQAAIEQARDLNGVNPVVAILGSFFALGTAYGLWFATNQLGIFFATHPVDSEVYFVIRSAQVVRNVAMGLISLASGFFGVTGLGIFLLGVRVAYGVTTGELDPTPIKQNQKEKVDMPNVWDLMLNKKPGRRGGGNSDNNPFGI